MELRSASADTHSIIVCPLVMPIAPVWSCPECLVLKNWFIFALTQVESENADRRSLGAGWGE